MPVVTAIAFPVFVFLLPLLMLLLFVPGSLSADETWMLRVCFPFLAPFSAVLWFIALHRFVTHRRSRHFHQFLVFLAAAVLVFTMLGLGVYRIR